MDEDSYECHQCTEAIEAILHEVSGYLLTLEQFVPDDVPGKAATS